MTGGELAFLGLGVVFGVATGAALYAVLRSRPPVPREVRLTVTPNSVPRRRSATLAADPFVLAAAEPARGGPADRWQSVRPAVWDRTPVLSDSLSGAVAGDFHSGRAQRPVLAVGEQFAVAGSIGGTSGALAFAAPRYGTIPRSLSSIGIQIHRETDLTLAALRQVAGRAADRAMGSQGLGLSIIDGGPADRVAIADWPDPGPLRAIGGGTPSRGGTPGGGAQPTAPRSGGEGGSGPVVGSGDDPTDPCAGQRRWADERCTLAYRARQQAEAAHSALGAAHRAYDEHQATADKGATIADPRTMRTAKETAQQAFRRDRAAAAGKDGVEAAARDWLTEINRINRAAREAAATVIREREAASTLTRSIERLTLDADAARRAAEMAEAACRAARDSVAECQESVAKAHDAARAAAAAAAAKPPEAARPAAGSKTAGAQPPSAARPAPAGTAAPARAAAVSPTRSAPATQATPASPASPASPATPATPARAKPTAPKKAERAEKPGELAAAFGRSGADAPAILRLVRGDRATLTRLAEQLAGDEAEDRKRWQLSLADLVDAILGRSIEAAALTFPLDHPFWSGFSQRQNRDITAALLSLGFRFDGLGGWADERVPTQRDLSLAVGYAGLDPMRVRPWPTEAEIGELFKDVAVAADEYLVEAAGGLTLGELVSMLGRRADALTEVWNDWPRLRPLLLAGS